LGHDSGGDVISKREDGDRWLADGERGRCNEGRQQTFETLACFGQISRDALVTWVDLGADVMRDKTDDPFAVGRSQALARVRKPIRQPVDPDAAIGISMTSTTLGSSSHAAIAGPSAVRSMRAPRETASGRKVYVSMTAPCVTGTRFGP
jgi:hypothetical protein